jgi:hypothetical protein
VTQLEDGKVKLAIRRRRTRRHRRNRLIQRAFRVLGIIFFTVGISAVVLRHFSPSLFRSTQSVVPSWQEAEASRSHLLLANQEQLFRPQTARPIYQYSVVPGGFENARELKWIAEHDPVVAAHYAGFDYEHAREVRLILARSVYVSYRIGNQVYWTHRRVSLHKGEKLITDGKMTARARCGNRVEEVPQKVMSAEEPPVAKFEEPVGDGLGTALQSPPIPFESALLTRPVTPGSEPTAPLSLYNPISGGGWTPLFPPPLPGGSVCAPNKKGAKEPTSSNKNKKGGPCSVPPETVPESGSWLLLASGIVGVFWSARRKLVTVD